MKKKKSLAAILCACSLLVGLAAPVSVQQVEAAKAKDVTESMKNNRDLRFIANQVNLFVESDAKVDPGTGPVRGKKIKLTKNRKVDIVSTAICAAQDEDEISTKDTIRKGMYARVDRNVLENHYERLFGDDVDLDSVKLNYKKNATTIKKNGRFYSRLGDWGMGAPTYRIRKISKLSKKDYQMQISNSFRSGSRDKLYYTQGYSTIRMKKTSDGFKLAGITYDNTITTSLRQQDLQAYAPIIKELRIGQGFAFADLGKDTDALLVTDYTYQYDPGTIAAIDATVYGLDKETGAPVEIGKVESAGTAYPLCADGQHFMYYGSGHGVAKATLTDGYTKFENVETAYEDFNSDGSSTFYYNDRVVPDDSNLTRLFNEWFGNARIIEFTIVQ